jgi:alpha-galactosidase
MIGTWIDRLDLRWSRWDYNIGPKPYWLKEDPTGKIQFRYIDGLYRILDTLLEDHPSWLVECCASGGRRIDLGTLKRAHTVWFSDQTRDPHICRIMQTGANRFLPSIYPNSSVPFQKGKKEGGVTTLDVLSRMCGAYAINGDITVLTDGDADRLKESIRLYKEIRHILNEDYFPLTRQPRSPSDWDVVEFVTRSRSESLVFAFRYQGIENRMKLKLKGLSPQDTYSVRDALTAEPMGRQSGQSLIEDGLDLELSADAACLLHLTAS